MKLDILAFGAHPDDVELSCSGTLIKEIGLGKTVGIVDLTGGELGTRGSKETRAIEAKNAGDLMEISARVNLDLGDGFFEITEENILKIVKLIRFYKPELVLTNAINDRHPDHGRGQELVERACFLAGLAKIETSFNDEVQKKWRPRKVLNYIQDNYIKPDVVVDITGQFDKKIESIMCYSSQFFNKDSNEPQTPISSQAFLDYIKGRAIQFGRGIGVKYGEGFTTSSYVGIDSLSDIL